MKKNCVFSICAMTLILFLASLTSAASVHCDFNNDGFDDLAIGVPFERVNGKSAGAVSVLYGRAGGLSATNNQLWHRDSPNVLGTASEPGQFGAALSCGDFDGNGPDDLAIGAPLTSENGLEWTGSVTILYGASSGLSARGNQLWSQNSAGVLDAPEAFDRFGASLTNGDFNGDGFSDLAVGVIGETFGQAESAGAVQIFYGTSAGLSSVGNQFWAQNSPGIPDGPESQELFGLSLVAANFGKDTSSDCYDDLAIGVPGENPNGVISAGAVHVLYGSAIGLSANGTQFLHEDTPGVVGTARDGDEFGSALTAGNFRRLDSDCGTRKIADLVVSGAEDAGQGLFMDAVFILYGNNSGITATNSQVFQQNSPGIAENSEFGDRFGSSLATGQTTTGGDYLVIGVPHESLQTKERAGAIHVLFTDPSTGRVTASGSRFYHQGTPGIKDSVEELDEFGSAVATGDFNADGEDDVAVGVRAEGLNGLNGVGAINVLYSARTSFTQFFHQNSVDIKGTEEPGDEFGSSFPQ